MYRRQRHLIFATGFLVFEIVGPFEPILALLTNNWSRFAEILEDFEKSHGDAEHVLHNEDGRLDVEVVPEDGPDDEVGDVDQQQVARHVQHCETERRYPAGAGLVIQPVQQKHGYKNADTCKRERNMPISSRQIDATIDSVVEQEVEQIETIKEVDSSGMGDGFHGVVAGGERAAVLRSVNEEKEDERSARDADLQHVRAQRVLLVER